MTDVTVSVTTPRGPVETTAISHTQTDVVCESEVGCQAEVGTRWPADSKHFTSQSAETPQSL